MIRNRYRDTPPSSPKKHPGDLLGRLWALFGKPDRVEFEGFTYELRDRDTGLRFTAYSGPSGPAYGGYPKDAAALVPVLDAFDALLDSTEPVECLVEYDTDFGRVAAGWRAGVPVLEPIRPKKRSR